MPARSWATGASCPRTRTCCGPSWTGAVSRSWAPGSASGSTTGIATSPPRTTRSGPPRAKTVRATRADREVVAFDELLAKRTGEAVPYSPKRTFREDDVVDHPLFGRGFVSAVRDAGKIEVTFRSDVKVLIHGRP